MRNLLDLIKNNKNKILKALALALYIVALVFLFVFIINLNVVAKTNDNIYSVDELIKISDDYDCILILGAGIKSDGSATDMLYDRIMVGFEAFENHKSEIVFLSGDSENEGYTETVTMKRVLNENGVENSNIICDGYGLSTYESIWRAKYVYGYDKILIITQQYHLHRAIYIAQELGLEAYGVDGALRTYFKQPMYSLREYIARVKDVIYAELCPDPKYLEIWEAMNE